MRRRELLTSISSGPSSGASNGYDWLDIGGVKWATKNVEAATETDYGLYFQWGDTQGYAAAEVGSGNGKKSFNWTSYKFNNDGSSPNASNMPKYNSTDGKTVLDLEDDAAAFNMGVKWRMPTIAEYQALNVNTTKTWETNYNNTGVNGRLFTSISNPNAKLFFPAAGYCANADVVLTGSIGNYFSSSLNTSNHLSGRILLFSSSSLATGINNRYNGQSVRGIYDENLPSIEYEYVDLGLPSGLLWCKQNVGAETETDYGLYFSWGEKNGYANAKSKTNRGSSGFTWGSYKYITGTSGQASALTKYNSTDGKTVLDLTDDAAAFNMGDNWRTPTIEEYQELTANTTSAWTTVNGVHGLKLTSKKYTSKYIFFPAAGYCSSATVNYSGSYGYFWSSSLNTSSRLRGRYLGFGSSGVATYDDYYRYYGQSVRGVMPSS